MKFKFIISLALCIFFFYGNSLGDSIQIVINHKPNANIIISANASDQIKNAASTLQQYIQRSSGALLPIRNEPENNVPSINIGYTQFVNLAYINVNNLDEDGFILKYANSKNFIILGGSDWGTEYGVYSFLERFLGVLWLMPTDLGIEITNLNSIDLSEVNIKENPVFLSRGLSPIDPDSKDDLGKWGRFNKIKNRISFHHNLDRLFDVKEFGKTNPDIYPTIKGRRYIPEPGDDNSWQPNFSAAESVDIAANKIIDYFSKYPNIKTYSLGINDSKLFDQSNASKMRRNGKINSIGLEDASDDYFLWANKVVEKVSRKFPGNKYGTLAYNNVFDPPSEKIGVNPNIIPYITRERLRWANLNFKNNDKTLTLRWGKQASSIGWYDYDYGLCYFIPRIFFHTQQDYLKWGSKNKVKYFYGELYPNWGEGPKAWILAKFLWNPNQNVDSLLTIWYDAFGGVNASLKLKAYFSLWEKYWTVDIQKLSWYNLKLQYLNFNEVAYLQNVPESYISTSDKLLNDALQSADLPLRKKRVSELIKMWNIYKIAILEAKRLNANYMHNLGISNKLVSALDQLHDDSLFKSSIELVLKDIQPVNK